MNIKNLDYKVLASKLNTSAKRARRILRRFDKFFQDIDLKDKRVLEIGAGNGAISCLLSLAGARSVISLEPEAEGASSGVAVEFQKNLKRLKINNVYLEIEKIQGFEASPNSFDLIVAIASVNHLDENACMHLHEDQEAVAIYKTLFQKIFTLLDINGDIVITDCSRKNAFSWLSNKLSMPSPIAPEIEWLKHQEPKVWAEILKSVGFRNVDWRWVFPAWIFCGIDKLLDNPVLAYLTTSYFVMRGSRIDSPS